MSIPFDDFVHDFTRDRVEGAKLNAAAVLLGAQHDFVERKLSMDSAFTFLERQQLRIVDSFQKARRVDLRS